MINPRIETINSLSSAVPSRDTVKRMCELLNLRRSETIVVDRFIGLEIPAQIYSYPEFAMRKLEEIWAAVAIGVQDYRCVESGCGSGSRNSDKRAHGDSRDAMKAETGVRRYSKEFLEMSPISTRFQTVRFLVAAVVPIHLASKVTTRSRTRLAAVFENSESKEVACARPLLGFNKHKTLSRKTGEDQANRLGLFS